MDHADVGSPGGGAGREKCFASCAGATRSRRRRDWAPGMARDFYWLAARLERARGEAQVRRLLLLALEAFNARPRFAIPCERTDSYAVAARLGRWEAMAPTPAPGP